MYISAMTSWNSSTAGSTESTRSRILSMRTAGDSEYLSQLQPSTFTETRQMVEATGGMSTPRGNARAAPSPSAASSSSASTTARRPSLSRKT